jgi:hypothetical protein
MIGDDLAPFFNTAEFARDGTLDGVAVRGILDLAYVAAGGGMGMSMTAPAFTLPAAAVPSAPVGKPLVVGNITYRIAQVEPDGTGVTVLILEHSV